MTPYTIVIDTREQLGYQFAAPFTGPRKVQLAVQTIVCGLPTGDYSLLGFESQIAIERKSLSDLYSTLGQGRARFTRELERLAAMEFAAVVVEAEWSEILGNPPSRSELNPKTVLCSVVAWQQRYPRIHWWTVPGRSVGEAVTIRLLDRFWRERESSASKEQVWTPEEILAREG